MLWLVDSWTELFYGDMQTKEKERSGSVISIDSVEQHASAEDRVGCDV